MLSWKIHRHDDHEHSLHCPVLRHHILSVGGPAVSDMFFQETTWPVWPKKDVPHMVKKHLETSVKSATCDSGAFPVGNKRATLLLSLAAEDIHQTILSDPSTHVQPYIQPHRAYFGLHDRGCTSGVPPVTSSIAHLGEHFHRWEAEWEPTLCRLHRVVSRC